MKGLQVWHSFHIGYGQRQFYCFKDVDLVRKDMSPKTVTDLGHLASYFIHFFLLFGDRQALGCPSKHIFYLPAKLFPTYDPYSWESTHLARLISIAYGPFGRLVWDISKLRLALATRVAHLGSLSGCVPYKYLLYHLQCTSFCSWPKNAFERIHFQLESSISMYYWIWVIMNIHGMGQPLVPVILPANLVIACKGSFHFRV